MLDTCSNCSLGLSVLCEIRSQRQRSSWDPLLLPIWEAVSHSDTVRCVICFIYLTRHQRHHIFQPEGNVNDFFMSSLVMLVCYCVCHTESRSDRAPKVCVSLPSLGSVDLIFCFSYASSAKLIIGLRVNNSSKGHFVVCPSYRLLCWHLLVHSLETKWHARTSEGTLARFHPQSKTFAVHSLHLFTPLTEFTDLNFLLADSPMLRCLLLLSD